MPLGWIWLVLTLLVIGAAVFITSYRNQSVMNSFHHQKYEEEPSPIRQREFRAFLTGLGVKLSVPGSDGEELSFTSPVTFTMEQRFNQEAKVHRGDQLCCDFISWSGSLEGSSRRYLQITWEGKLRQVSVTPRQAARLYRAALEQNGLEEQFRRETGQKLSTRSAREALRGIDGQIFQLGLYAPSDYPFDRAAFRTWVLLTGGSAPLILLVFITVLPELAEYARYRRWLEAYNRENSRRWKQVEGQLPQFVSLEESGGSDRPKFAYGGPGILERIRRLFSPISRK